MIGFDAVNRLCSVESMGCANVMRFSERQDTHFRGADRPTKTILAYDPSVPLTPYSQGPMVAEALDQPNEQRKCGENTQLGII